MTRSSAGMSGRRKRASATATSAPQICATTNAGTLLGAMPAKVLLNVRPTVTAGLAKLVDDVNQYAAAMYPPTANAATCARPARTTPRITMINPNVATLSLNQSAPDERVWVDTSTAGSSNMTFATIAPRHAPATWAPTYTSASVVAIPPRMRSASVTTGLKCAPDTAPNARMSATSAAPVAIEFSSNCNPVSSGDSRCAAMPEPTTAATRSAVPVASAVARRARSTFNEELALAAALGRLGRAVAAERVRSRIDGAQLARRHFHVGEDGVDLPRCLVGAVDPHLVLHR